jgi:hypothetical protein
MHRLRPLGLIVGEDELPAGLLEACHEGRLVGGLSLSLRTSPDEAVGWLAHAMGGEAKKLKVLDVRKGTPPVLQIQCGAVREDWPAHDLVELVAFLNELFPDDDAVKALVVLGEREDMLQVWALRNEVLEVLLGTQLLEGAWNLAALRDRFDEWADDEEDDGG